MQCRVKAKSASAQRLEMVLVNLANTEDEVKIIPHRNPCCRSRRCLDCEWDRGSGENVEKMFKEANTTPPEGEDDLFDVDFTIVEINETHSHSRQTRNRECKGVRLKKSGLSKISHTDFGDTAPLEEGELFKVLSEVRESEEAAPMAICGCKFPPRTARWLKKQCPRHFREEAALSNSD
eukprot:SAG11_NODE_3066_length_2715_cov_1.813838_1_plen_178_part_10